MIKTTKEVEIFIESQKNQIITANKEIGHYDKIDLEVWNLKVIHDKNENFYISEYPNEKPADMNPRVRLVFLER